MNTHIFKQGRHWRPDVYLSHAHGQAQIWKDVRHLKGLKGWFGGWAMARERRLLAKAGARGDAPFPLASPHPRILAMTFVEGRELQPGDDTALASLMAVLGRLHAQGIAHNDIHRSNVRVVGSRAMLLDFGAASQLPALLKPLTALLQRRDLQHARKLLARYATDPQPVPKNPRWIRGLQGLWNTIRRKRPAAYPATG